MTSKEYQQVTQAFQPLLRFLAQTHHDEAWHDSRRQFLAHADRQIAVLVDEPVAEPKDKPTPGKKETKPC